MNSSRRVIACSLVAVALLGSLPLPALAQQAVVEVMPTEQPTERGTDIYDVGAGVITVARMPGNVALCGLGGVAGAVVFLITFGSAYQAATRAVEEGCARPWIIRGDELRPVGMPGIFTRGGFEATPRRW
jgi:hypothetical protein